MTPTHYFMTLGLPLITILLVFAMRSYATIQQARVRAGADEAYRLLAERALAREQDTASALSALQISLAEVKTRLGAIEQILKTVE